MDLKHLITSTNGIDAHVRVPAGEIRAALAEVDVMRRERDDLAARLAKVEQAEPVAWVPMHPRFGALWAMTTATPSEERLPSHYPLKPLYTRPAEPARELPNSITAAIADFRDACIACAISECSDHDRDPDYASADRAEECLRAELAARLAEIEAQQPSMYVLRSTAGSVRPTVVTRTSLLSCAQADRVDAGEDHLDPDEATSVRFHAGPAPTPEAL